MAFYENTIIVRQDVSEKELASILENYKEIINKSSGKILKTETWGLMKLANKIKNYNKGFFLHFKFKGDYNTLNEIEKKIKVDTNIVRHLTVKYSKLDIDKEYFENKN